MSNQPLSQAYKDLLYLIRCAVRQEEASDGWYFQTPLSRLYRLACNHSIEAFLYDTVITTSLAEEDKESLKEWQLAHDKAYRRYLLFTVERQAILQELEKAGIWYLPLKGVILQEDYPKPHHRQMSDNDILFDKDRRYDVKTIMVQRGYKVGHFNYHFDDVYYKEPFYNFEMHVRAGVAPEFEAYFEALPKALLHESTYARQMTNEDFYLYLLSHELRHYQTSGTGLRSLIDLHYYLSKHNQDLNWAVIDEVVASVGVSDFDHHRRELVSRLFSDDFSLFNQAFADEGLAYYCSSGTYGTLEQLVDNRLTQVGEGKHRLIGFYLKKFFQVERLIVNYPILKHHRYLIPFYMIFRLIRGLFNPVNWKELGLVLKKLGKEAKE